MSVRVLGCLVLSLSAGGAQASSIVALGVSTSTPSIVTPGALEPAKTYSTPSIVALGDPVPDVTDEKVAAIPHKPERKHGFTQAPMIIRGGAVGSAFASPAPAAAPAKATAAAAPAASPEPAATTARPKDAPQPEPAATVQPAPSPAAGKLM